MSDTVTALLTQDFPAVTDPEIEIQRLSLIGVAQSHLQNFESAALTIAAARRLCSRNPAPACARAESAAASLATQRGLYAPALASYSRALAIARASHQPFEEAAALGNIGATLLEQEHFDEAIDWLRESNRIAARLSAEDILLNNTGNLGWAWYQLGQPDRALDLFADAEHHALALGDIDDQITWLTTEGSALEKSRRLPAALQSYRQALSLATESHNREEVVNSLESLANVAVESGDLSAADAYLRRLDPLIRTSDNHLDALTATLIRAKAALQRPHTPQAETLLRSVRDDPDSQTSMRLSAEHQLARLFAGEGRFDDALAMYSTALTTFESARAQLKDEDSKLPFFANATPLYDDYIDLLVRRNKITGALSAADQSRARTLEQGLGLVSATRPFEAEALHPQAIAAAAHATLLFYWIGEKQSYLWAVTARKTAVFSLPPAAAIEAMVQRYHQALLGPEDPLDARDDTGFALYRTLIEPAQALLPPQAKVIVLTDGVLSRINFETLLVPGPTPHYWIEDASVVSAPSLRMLRSQHHADDAGGQLLLVGDAVANGPEYPGLPNASEEMREVGHHFAAPERTVLAGARATSAAYLHSPLQQFAYIDFVAHGVASRTDPLDSAIILSADGGAENSFKLYARDIIRHPISARLVTISACYSGGTRSYAGEGLVGLSWAFLRAGAHQVIGALWEVSDDSTPRLMDSLYQGIAAGLPAPAALRQAKLQLLHSHTAFRRPFYWGPFQLYTGS